MPKLNFQSTQVVVVNIQNKDCTVVYWANKKEVNHVLTQNYQAWILEIMELSLKPFGITSVEEIYKDDIDLCAVM